MEKMINESILHFSPPLRELISKVGGKIGSSLLKAERTDIKPDITFVDLDKEGYLSFTTMKNAVKLLTKEYPTTDEMDWKVAEDGDFLTLWQNHLDNKENDVYGKSRNSVKIGKFINKVFPGKFKDKDVEDFVNKMKGGLEVSGEKFEIVEGEDIEFWYKSENYAKEEGSLGSSCMRNQSGIFRIYTDNPEVCRMLILKENDKILGRALIWKLDAIRKYSGGDKVEDVEYFMDRQYTIKDSDVEKFRNYAKEQGWSYKTNNNHHSYYNLTKPDGDAFNVRMTVQVKKADSSDYDYNSYPYLDTFRRYNPQTGILYNDEDEDSENDGMYILNDTGGGYSRIEGGYYSEYYDRMIPEDEAVYSDWLGTHIWSDSAVYVDRGESRYHGYYPDDYDDIVFDEWIDEYIHRDNGIYSDWYGYWLLNDNAVHVIVEIESDGDVDQYHDNYFHVDDDDIVDIDIDMQWYEFLSDKHPVWTEFSYILKSLMTSDLNNDWIPKQYAIEVYPIGEAKPNSVDVTGVEYLTEIDAQILGYEIDKENPETIDQFHYHKDLEPILPKLYKRGSDEWIKAAQQLDGKKGQLRIKFKDFDESDYKKSLWKIVREYGDRLDELENDEYIEIDPDKITITREMYLED